MVKEWDLENRGLMAAINNNDVEMAINPINVKPL